MGIRERKGIRGLWQPLFSLARYREYRQRNSIFLLARPLSLPCLSASILAHEKNFSNRTLSHERDISVDVDPFPMVNLLNDSKCMIFEVESRMSRTSKRNHAPAPPRNSSF